MIPKGFWSYAQGDDKHLEGVLSDLRAKVAGEVSMLLGYDVDIFQDIRGLRTGDRWEERLRAEVTAATFLVPILTPRYFNRPFCREETLIFLRVAREVGVEARVFPIRFVEFDEEEGDEVRMALGEFQYKDFLSWRFESDPTRRAALLHAFAKDVKAGLRTTISLTRPAGIQSIPSVREHAAPPEGPRAPEPPEVQTLTVDPVPGRADFSSISAAIAAAAPGGRIIVRPGTYREALRLSKPLKLVGEGERERILVTTAEGSPLLCDAALAHVSGMTFRREAGSNGSSVWITAGAVEIEDCIMESQSLECVKISSSTPTLRRCIMRSSNEIGLFIIEGARPIIEDCEIESSRSRGVWVWGKDTYATLRRCVARDGGSDGFHFDFGAGGVLERCESQNNAGDGITIAGESIPELRECIVRRNRKGGVFVMSGGRGRLEECTIEENAHAGVIVLERGDPIVFRCTIRGNGWQGIRIAADGMGTFEENDLRLNNEGAWYASDGAAERFVLRNNKAL